MTSFIRLSPVDSRITWQGDWATPDSVDASFVKSVEAFKNWSRVPVEERMECARRYALALDRNKDAISLAITLESGKPLWESQQEVAAAKSKVENAIDALLTRRSDWSSQTPTARNVIRYQPLGAVLVLGPYNLPLHLPGAHIVPSLIAGNTVIFKPSEKTPAVGEWIVKCWQEAGLPEGCLEMLHGAVEVAKRVVDQRELAGVFFTGSHRGGLALHRQLAGRPDCLLALEMGGNNPLVVDRVRDVDAAIQVLVQSCYITSGQRCTCARRLILIESHENRLLLERFASSLAKIRVGSPLGTPEPFMGCLVSSEACDEILQAQRRYIENGGRLLVESRRVENSPNSLTPGLVEIGCEQMNDQEHFGPLTTAVFVKDFEEAVRIANRTQYGLSAGLLSDEAAKFQEFVSCIRAGIVNWNNPTTGASGVMPFGGVGASGNHRPSGYFAADYCSYPKASVQVSELKPLTNLPPGLEHLTS
ncbi:succinylglutamate-semialdehyde dehydrogenase [Pirellulaceae bacterium SH449]